MMKDEIREDKYPFQSYQGIIGLLMILQKKGFDIGDINDVINIMNSNIEKSEENVEIEKFGYTFEDDFEMQNVYNQYVDKIKLQANSKSQSIKSAEIIQCFEEDDWAETLTKYYEEHHSDFFIRYGFIDLLKEDVLIEKMNHASVKEWYEIKDMFKEVYRGFYINEFFMNDRVKIESIRDSVQLISVEGITKEIAKQTLVSYLDNILQRLQIQNNTFSL